MTDPVEKHTVHCRNGGKVVIKGSRVEVQLPGPIVIHRKSWVQYFAPSEEVRRTLSYGSNCELEDMLEEAFKAVPMTVHEEKPHD